MLRGYQEARGSFEEKNAVEETQVPPSASSRWGKLVWTLASQSGSLLISRMSLGKLPWVSLSVFIVEQGKDLPRGNHVGSNLQHVCKLKRM